MVEIESYRIGNVFGIHRIVFENAEGLTTFQHIANSRNIFAKALCRLQDGFNLGKVANITLLTS
jgi:dihydrodipicolinate reductase